MTRRRSSPPIFSQLPDYERLCAASQALPELDPEVVMATSAVRGVGTELVAALEASLAPHGLSEGRLRMLGNLFLEAEPQTPSRLAELAGVTRGTITGLIDCLERGGLVARRPDESDRRAVRVELLPAGRELMERVLPGHLARLSRLMGGLTRDEQRELVRLLLKVRAGIGALQPDEPADQGDPGDQGEADADGEEPGS